MNQPDPTDTPRDVPGFGSAPREDILVSICLGELPELHQTELILTELGKDLAASFRYWEVLVVLDAEKAARYDILLQKLPNIRIFKTLPNTNSYRRRVSAASEAIGDVVAMTAVEELPYLNICGMISRAQAEGCAVVGQWTNGRRILDPILAALGRSGGGALLSKRWWRSASGKRPACTSSSGLDHHAVANRRSPPHSWLFSAGIGIDGSSGASLFALCSHRLVNLRQSRARLVNDLHRDQRHNGFHGYGFFWYLYRSCQDSQYPDGSGD